MADVELVNLDRKVRPATDERPLPYSPTADNATQLPSPSTSEISSSHPMRRSSDLVSGQLREAPPTPVPFERPTGQPSMVARNQGHSRMP